MNPISQKTRPSKKGFALVVAMTLVSFVILMLLSLGAMVSVELSLAGQNSMREQARINALTGLSIALGELQVAAGDDQRVTAAADILSSRQAIADDRKMITGVWKTGDYSGAAGPHLTMTERWNWSVGNDSTVLTNGEWANGPRWLVSSEKPITNLSTQSWDSLSPTLKTASMIISESRNAAGAPSGTRVETLAGIVPLEDANGSIEGGYAWWIGDEGIKAKVNPSGAFPEEDLVKERLLNASRGPNVILSAWDGLEGFSAENAQEAFARSDSPVDLFESGGLTNDAASSLAPRYYDHWTSSSFGLLSNTRDGGLKKDLTRGLGDEFPETMAGRTLWWFRESGGKYMKGPLWDVVYSYANLYRDKMPWIASLGLQNDGKQVVHYSNTALPYTYESNRLMNRGPRGVSDPQKSSASLEPRSPVPYADSEKAFLVTDDTLSAYTLNSRWLYQDNDTDAGDRIPFKDSEPPSFSKKSEGIQHVVSPVVLGVVAKISLASAKVSDVWDLDLDVSENSKKPPPYWNRSNIASALNFNPLTNPTAKDSLDKLAFELRNGEPTEQSFYAKMDSHYVLHVIVDPHVIIWNPYNIDLEGFSSEVRWFPGYRMNNVSPNFDNLDWKIETSDGPLLVKANGDSSAGREFFSLGGLMRSYDRDAGVNTNNGLKLEFDMPVGQTLGAGEIRAFSMSSFSDTARSGNIISLQGDEGASSLSGVISSPLYAEPIPEGTKIFGIELKTELDNDVYTRESWEIQPWIGRINADTADLENPDGGNRRARMVSSSIPEVDIGSSVVRYYGEPPLYEEAPLVEELNFTLGVDHNYVYARPNNDVGRKPYNSIDRYRPLIEHAIDTYNVAYLSAFVQPANLSSDRGLPLIAQFNPAPLAFLETTKQNSNAFLWKMELLDPASAESLPGLISVINGIPGWGADFGLNGEQNIALFDIPRYPLQSLGALMHANLGQYDVNPTYAVGSGYANPLVPTDRHYVTRDFQTVDDAQLRRFYLPDVSYLLNEGIFDEYFFSTIPEDTGGNRGFRDKSRTPPFGVDFDEDYLITDGALPNPRMTIVSGETSPDELRDFDEAARHLMVDGAFNVNSTSKPAWKAFLSGLNSLKIESIASGVKTHASNFPQMRSSLPYAHDSQTWNGYKALSETELDSLAEAIVAEVRLRGPFLSMSDFVNRRLVDNETGKVAALQGAIDKTVNAVVDNLGGEVAYEPTGDWAGNFDSSVLASKQGAGAPGWLLQQDILKTMAPVMTARSDTFTIRAYGSTVNPLSGKVDAEVWCEALVQRYPDYVEEADGTRSDPTQPVWTKEWGDNHEWEASINDQVGDLAAQFGREFRIVKFRWLSPSEIGELSGS
ncbi:hypothetical protein [Rubellicoccus peritrichatus]|uniref:Uncharacterized protein n=1 Tax=Rubellicoccus peritrichatus TaxID=3080537 RepID=A0AAQ3QWH5_9BACT|nr:hypothetical protein [Puniceicoccus sp. CR14]WOO42723.1 hypothetical protein RZN69_06440 [Puniceicoccus sp. CR14]